MSGLSRALAAVLPSLSPSLGSGYGQFSICAAEGTGDRPSPAGMSQKKPLILGPEEQLNHGVVGIVLSEP